MGLSTLKTHLLHGHPRELGSHESDPALPALTFSSLSSAESSPNSSAGVLTAWQHLDVGFPTWQPLVPRGY